MNSFALVADIEHFFNASATHQPFLEALKIFADYAEGSADILRGMGTGQNISQAASNYHQRFANLAGLLPQIRNRAFFDSQKNLASDIARLSDQWPESKAWLEKVHSGIDRFAEMYDDYLRTRNIEDAFSLAVNAKALLLDIEGMFNSLDAILKSFQTPEPSDDRMSLTIYLPGYIGIADIAKKLHAINEIYEEACGLLKISMAEYPLTIDKLESGSLFVKLVGSRIVLAAIIFWLGNGASYMYRNTTAEGQIEAISQKVDKIDKILGLRQSLVEAQIDTSQMDHHIQKSAIKVASDLEVLLTQSSIVINGDVISRQTEIAKMNSESITYDAPKKIELSNNKLLPPATE
ncbi:MAG: hypothetical protein EOP14_03890 [Pseudomonas sp.]|nr:MAG: hypothetical protein EOP14_03890 [Pseudomonas sp.]